MGTASMKSIKLRIKSMESTKQITKAMQMVSTSKLRHAREKVLASRPYFEILYDTISDIIASNNTLGSEFTRPREVRNVLYVTIAGDRGLAGGYNSNLIKLALREISDNNADEMVVPMGRKSVEYFTKHGIPILTEIYSKVETVSISDCFTLARGISKRYLDGEFDEVRLIWTNFTSMLSQTPSSLKLLPLNKEIYNTGNFKNSSEVIFDPSQHDALHAIVTEYLGGMIYGAVCESRASELASRSNAMDSATKNAEELIESLSLSYNRARQSAITQEITEIVAGAEK